MVPPHVTGKSYHIGRHHIVIVSSWPISSSTRRPKVLQNVPAGHGVPSLAWKVFVNVGKTR
jgi:hypothetical protein